MQFHDLDQLQELHDLFIKRSGPPGLFHATRARFDSRQVAKASLKQHWNEFLADEKTFEHSWNEVRSGRLQESCYFGAREKLNDYTGLAARVRGLFLSDFTPTTYYHRDARVDRNQWTLGLYHAASVPELEWEIAIDFRGNTDCSQSDFETLTHCILCGRYDRDEERRILETWAEELKGRGVRKPRYVYAAILTDLFQASTAAVEVFIKNLKAGKHQPVKGAWLPKSSHDPAENSTQADAAPGSITTGPAEGPFVYAGHEKEIMDALYRKALKKQPLADALFNGDGTRLYKPGGFKRLREKGLVLHQNGIGFYRPDEPPPERVGPPFAPK